jgi:hypothetical protein
VSGSVTPLIILYSSLIEFAIRRLSYSLRRWSVQRDSCNKGEASFREDLIPGRFQESCKPESQFPRMSLLGSSVNRGNYP